jgi:hypothetical protein
MRIFSLLTGGIDLPKLSTEVASLRLASEDTNAALADHIVKANARMATIERVQSDNTAQCQIRMNGLQDLIASRALAEDVETLRLKLDRVDDFAETTSDELHDAVQKLATIKANHEDIAALRATVAGLSAKVETLRMKLDRLDSEIGNCTFGDAREREDGFTPRGLSGVVSDLSIGFYRQAGEIEALKKQVEALTAAKLSEVKARKAPKKSG